jgi:Flp pilus assembly protein TadG
VVSVWLLLVTAGAFTLLLGLVVDGGAAIDARREAARTAEQAARVAADQLDTDSVRTGGADVATAAAAAAGHRYLAGVDAQGSVRVVGGMVTVTVTSREPTVFLSAIGLPAIRVEQTATARSVDDDTRPEELVQ